jgi:hypothetical protein
MQATSAIEIEQTRCNSHPGWDFMQATSAIEIEQPWHTQLTSWMGFHAGNISNQN